jgi:hypothetical protein
MFFGGVMSEWLRRAVSFVAILVGLIAVLAAPIAPAYAAVTPCQDVLLVWMRGSDAKANSDEMRAFWGALNTQLDGLHRSVLEGGNFDNAFLRDEDIHGPGRYEAAGGPHPVGVYEWAIAPGYGVSVATGTDELVNFLNSRANECPKESTVAGGYSQGADGLGWALARNGGDGRVQLSATARRNIAFAALYGDPKNNAGPAAECMRGTRASWVRGDSPGCKYTAASDYAPGSITPLHGLLGARDPYVPQDFVGRFGSWCAADDRLCNGSLSQIVGLGNHGSIYKDHWIAQSAPEIAAKARAKHAELNPPPAPPTYTPPLNANLFFVKNHSSTSGKVEIHSAEVATGYGSGQHSTSYITLADQSKGWFEVETGRTLYFIKTKDATSGKVEVHTATNGSGYQSGEHLETRFSTAEQDNGWFQMVGNALWYIKTRNTGSGKVEIHLATRASNYQSGASMTTWLTTADQNNGYFQMVGNDLFFVKTRNTSNGRIEVHSATQASNWQAGQHNETYISSNNQNNGWFQMLGPDLYFVQTKNTGTGKVEIHTAAATAGYQTGFHGATYISGAEQDKGWFQIDLK